MRYAVYNKQGLPCLKEVDPQYIGFATDPIQAIDNSIQEAITHVSQARRQMNQYMEAIKNYKAEADKANEFKAKLITFKDEVAKAQAKGIEVPRLTKLIAPSPRATTRPNSATPMTDAECRDRATAIARTPTGINHTMYSSWYSYLRAYHPSPRTAVDIANQEATRLTATRLSEVARRLRDRLDSEISR